jgi:iron complex transport system permease protein
MKKDKLNYKMLLIMGIIFTIIISIISIMIGNIEISLTKVIKIIFQDRSNVENYIKTIIFDVRLPRIIMAVLIGMMLASSGVVVQNVFQNPLADPYIIGISASATFGAVIAFVLNLPSIFYGIFGFITCLITSVIIFKLANKEKKIHTATLLIVGIAISSFLGAFTSFAMYLIGEDSFKIVMWTMGYLGNATWMKILIVSMPFILVQIYFIYKRFDLDALMTGEVEAHSLGLNIEKTKIKLLIVASLIVAFSVAFSGMIGFVGLIIPHTMRMLVGSSNKKLIPISTIFGGLFLLVCDTLGRVIFSPVEIPIGVVTSFFGAPFFLYLAFKSKKR